MSPVKHVYALHDVEYGPVKVGSSVNPPKRRMNLKTGSPSAEMVYVHIEVVTYELGTMVERLAKETLWHDGYHKIREWFTCPPEVARDYIIAAHARIRGINMPPAIPDRPWIQLGLKFPTR